MKRKYSQYNNNDNDNDDSHESNNNSKQLQKQSNKKRTTELSSKLKHWKQNAKKQAKTELEAVLTGKDEIVVDSSIHTRTDKELAQLKDMYKGMEPRLTTEHRYRVHLKGDSQQQQQQHEQKIQDETDDQLVNSTATTATQLTSDHLDEIIEMYETLFETKTREKARVDVRLESTKPKTTKEQHDALADYNRDKSIEILKIMSKTFNSLHEFHGLVQSDFRVLKQLEEEVEPISGKLTNKQQVLQKKQMSKSIPKLWQVIEKENKICFSGLDKLEMEMELQGLTTNENDNNTTTGTAITHKTLGDLFKV
jgi:hypothetical protein